MFDPMDSGAAITTANSALGRDFVESLAKGLHVLDALGAAPDGLTMTETAERTGLSRAASRRLLLTLVELGYVQQQRRAFKLTARVLSLGSAYLRGTPLWELAEPVMRQLSGELGESCSAAVLDGHDVIYVARVPARRIMSVTLTVGARLPAYCTSLGRVLLAGLTPAELGTWLHRAELRAHTEHTITGRHQLMDRIIAARRDGFALVSEEMEIGLRSLAVPINNRDGQPIAALNVSVVASRTTPETMRDSFLPRMAGAAAEISRLAAVQTSDAAQPQLSPLRYG